MIEADRFKCIGGCADGQWVKNHPRERQIKLYDRRNMPSVLSYNPKIEEIPATVPMLLSSIYRIENFSVYDENEKKSWFVWVEVSLSLAKATAMLVEGYRETSEIMGGSNRIPQG